VRRRDGLRRRALALTFDDGPSRWTPAVLDLLAEHEARATFFVVGRYAEERPELVARMAQEGHEVGNHTFDHVDAAYTEDAELGDQIARTSEAILAAGAQPHLMRPPYGREPERVAELAHAQGLAPTVLWSVEGRDWEERPPGEIAADVLRGSAPGAIVLLHDGVPPGEERECAATVAALGWILPALRGEGYELVTLSELLAG
jgi:chitooligosaccharide deacetylase